MCDGAMCEGGVCVMVLRMCEGAVCVLYVHVCT